MEDGESSKHINLLAPLQLQEQSRAVMSLSQYKIAMSSPENVEQMRLPMTFDARAMQNVAGRFYPVQPRVDSAAPLLHHHLNHSTGVLSMFEFPLPGTCPQK
jgi:hypothetical protein